METVIRVLPYADADGATNMAADEVLVHTATRGIASLRYYGWTTATASLGYFQPAAVLQTDSRLASLPWVRRPSGGATLVHHHELTYAIACPPGDPWHSGGPWMLRMHQILLRTLSEFGLDADLELVSEHPAKHGNVLCFQQFTPGDLLCRGKKIVGSAQRKYHQALLQHGSVLLRQSDHTPSLPGIQELTGQSISIVEFGQAFLQTFAEETGWKLSPSDWTDEERTQIADLAREKYSTVVWNARR